MKYPKWHFVVNIWEKSAILLSVLHLSVPMFCIGKIGILKISSKYSKSSLEGKKIAGPGPWIMSQKPVFRSLSATASPFYSGSKMLWRFWRLRFLRGFKCFWRCWHDGEMSEGRKRRSGEEENSGHTVPGIDSVQCFHFVSSCSWFWFQVPLADLSPSMDPTRTLCWKSSFRPNTSRSSVPDQGETPVELIWEIHQIN